MTHGSLMSRNNFNALRDLRYEKICSDERKFLTSESKSDFTLGSGVSIISMSENVKSRSICHIVWVNEMPSVSPSCAIEVFEKSKQEIEITNRFRKKSGKIALLRELLSGDIFLISGWWRYQRCLMSYSLIVALWLVCSSVLATEHVATSSEESLLSDSISVGGELESAIVEFEEFFETHRREADSIVQTLRETKQRDPAIYLERIRELKAVAVKFAQYLNREDGFIDEIEGAIRELDNLEREAMEVPNEGDREDVILRISRARDQYEQHLESVISLVELLESQYDSNYGEEEYLEILVRLREYEIASERIGKFIDETVGTYIQMQNVVDRIIGGDTGLGL